MQKLMVLALAIVFESCVPNPHMTDENSEVDATSLRLEGDKARKDQTLPSSFTQCPDNFYWSTKKFSQESLEYSYVRGDNEVIGPFKSGFGSHSVDLSEEERRVCEAISDKIKGISSMEYNLYQHFDGKEVLSIVKPDNDFHDVAPRMAYIENSAYRFDKKENIKYELYRLNIPVSVKCENSWSVKKYERYPFRAFFRQPKGKCHFSTQNYELELSQQEKVTIAINGFYEQDAEYPGKIVIVKIDSFGFLETLPDC